LSNFLCQGPSKKRRVAPGKDSLDGPGRKPKPKGKEKAADREIIPIPVRGDGDEIELSDEDLDMLEDYGGAISFLSHLDEKGISKYVRYRSSRVSLTIRLFQEQKGDRQTPPHAQACPCRGQG
jgi:hypothetical protein